MTDKEKDRIDKYAGLMEECISYGDEDKTKFCGYNHKRCENILRELVEEIKRECANDAVSWYRSGQASHHQSVGKDLRAVILGTGQPQGDDGCEVHIYRGPRTEEERMANIERKNKADQYAMHVCGTCSSESGAECTRRNCHLNDAWAPKPAREES